MTWFAIFILILELSGFIYVAFRGHKFWGPSAIKLFLINTGLFIVGFTIIALHTNSLTIQGACLLASAHFMTKGEQEQRKVNI